MLSLVLSYSLLALELLERRRPPQLSFDSFHVHPRCVDASEDSPFAPFATLPPRERV